MKKIKFLSAVALCAAMCLLNSCMPEEKFDEVLLINKWQSGTEFEVYQENHEGYSWNTADDVTEAEAQRFTWSLKSSTLTKIEIMEITGEGTIPKTYTIIELSETTLVYEDEYGNRKSFTKAN